MKKLSLAFLDKVNLEEVQAAVLLNRLDDMRRRIYAKAAEFALFYKGDSFAGFTQADTAWGQKTYEPCGVVFGETEPALFMYYLALALEHRENRTYLAVYNRLNQVGKKVFGEVIDDSKMSAYAIESDLFISDPWIKRYTSGGFLHDCGLYSLCHGKSNLDGKECEEIKKDIRYYALCVLDIYE